MGFLNLLKLNWSINLLVKEFGSKGFIHMLNMHVAISHFFRNGCILCKFVNSVISGVVLTIVLPSLGDRSSPSIPIE